MEPDQPAENSTCPVRSYNEWDPLEEIIVGRLEYATIPTGHITVTGGLPRHVRFFYGLMAGITYPKFMLRRAQRELDELIRILECEGVVVRRPEIADFRVKFKTPHWKSTGYTTACPRDGVLVIGNEIIETPMSWRCRYFEMNAYRPLFRRYAEQGARWTAAPRPELRDELYDREYCAPDGAGPRRYIVNEHEPVFDAADFTRCGADLFVIRSNTTNYSGIAWLRRHLGESYRIHEIETTAKHPMHIDTTLVPLAPGRMLANPDFVDVARLPPALKKWEILIPPQPDPVEDFLIDKFSLCSKWISLNVLVLDGKKVLVEGHQKSMINALKDWGFEPVPCPFQMYGAFGGGIHCATLDIRRRGELQSYF
jgi:glycine amidinotransferase